MKFDLDEVLAVLNEADEALSTAAVAQVCRLRRGLPERVAEPHEVRYALRTLEQQDLVVSAADRDSSSAHGHLVPFGDAKSRYWATPALSEKLRLEREDREVRHRHVNDLTVEFRWAWEVAGGPEHPEKGWPWPYTAVRPLADQSSARYPVVGVYLTAGQLEWLIGRLHHLPPV